jgi:hypothetical protein
MFDWHQFLALISDIDLRQATRDHSRAYRIASGPAVGRMLRTPGNNQIKHVGRDRF